MNPIRDKIFDGIFLHDDVSVEVFNRISKYFNDKSCDVSYEHAFHIGLIEVLK